MRKEKNNEEESTQSSNHPNDRDILKNRQVTINNMFKKGIKEEACQAIARFFYNNVIPFNVAKSEEFTAMFDLVSRHDLGFKPPSYHEIIVKYLKEEVTNTSLALLSHMDEWKKTRCTIITDGWNDKKIRTNFLVNNPNGIVFVNSIDASAISKITDKEKKVILDTLCCTLCGLNVGGF